MPNNYFTNVKSLIINNKEVKSIVIDEVDGGIIYKKPTTLISLTTSNNQITYGESVILNGSLPFEGQVKIYQNNVFIRTVFTSNGLFSETISGLGAGEYTFHAVFEGDETHVAGESNGVVVTINKITPVLTLSCEKSAIHLNETITITGTTTIDGTINLFQSIDGQTESLLESIESTNGTFTYTFTNTTRDNKQIFAVKNSTNNYNQAQSNNLLLTYRKYSTNLLIEVPALVYSDTFNVTGILTNENNEPIVNDFVRLYTDNKFSAALRTNSNGMVTFYRSAPTSITTYTFQLQYEGNTDNSNSNSSIITRVVNKETSVLNITSPLNESTYTDNDSEILISGNLSDNDGTPLGDKDIKIKEGNNLLNTLTTDTNGNFTGTINLSQLNSQNIIQTLTLISDKNILSYYDEDIATFTATLNGGTVSGQQVIFKQGNTILDTVITDSNGTAEYEYESQGIGDVTITVEYMNLQETYTIEDCHYYNNTEYTTTSTTLNIPLPPTFKLEYDSIPTTRNYSTPYLDIGRSNNDRILIGQYTREGVNGIIIYTDSSTNKPLPNVSTLNEINHYTFTYDGADYTILRDNDSLNVTGTDIHLDKIIHIESGNGGSLTNIKVKSLEGGN